MVLVNGLKLERKTQKQNSIYIPSGAQVPLDFKYDVRFGSVTLLFGPSVGGRL